MPRWWWPIRGRSPIEDQTLLIDGIRQDWAQHVESLKPDWLLNGTTPPPMSSNWSMLSTEDQQDLALSRWDAFVREEMNLYFGEVPAGGMESQSPLITTEQGWPWGSGMAGEWADLHQPGQADIAQFLNTGFILNGEGQDYTHGNLCGQLAVISNTGQELGDETRLNQAGNWMDIAARRGGEDAVREHDEATAPETGADLFLFYVRGWLTVTPFTGTMQETINAASGN